MRETLRPTFSKRRAKFIAGGAIVVFALVGLVGWAMSRPRATSFYLTVSELRAAGPTDGRRDLRVNGRVVPGSIDRSGLATSFTVAEGGEEVVVRTDAPLPDAFKSNSEVVARGRFDGHLFTASEVLAKCPSKFKAA